MKIAYCSDLHLEFGDIKLENTENADVLVLAGDIVIAEYLHTYKKDAPYEGIKVSGTKNDLADRFRRFIKNVSEEFPNVVVIAGNHEFYNGRWHASLEHLREEWEAYDNIYFLERERVILGDVTFIGATLWTDMNRNDPITKYGIRFGMNDFKLIRNDHREYSRLDPDDVVIRHRTSMDYIMSAMKLSTGCTEKVVIVGHHSPSKQSIHPKYANCEVTNGGYSSDLEDFIYRNPRIKVWFHGHTHEGFDYQVNETRILCNPRGYANDSRSLLFQLKYVEV